MKYSISDLAQLSGISVHNIRIWERRYGALKPSRTVGNTRYYDDEQLKRLLCIAGLYHAGHKISRACALDKDNMSALLQDQIELTVSEEHRFEYFIVQIVNHGMAYNEARVNELISALFSNKRSNWDLQKGDLPHPSAHGADVAERIALSFPGTFPFSYHPAKAACRHRRFKSG